MPEVHGFHVLSDSFPTLMAALHTGYCRRAGVRVTAAAAADELVFQAARLRPHVVIVGAGRAPAEQLRRVARDLRLAAPGGGPLLLLALPRALADRDRAGVAYDGTVSLEDPEPDLARALAPLLGAPARLERRVSATMRALLSPPDDVHVEGQTFDVSPGGAGLALPRLPRAAGPLPVSFSHGDEDDDRSVDFTASVLWSDARGPGPVRVGVRFVEPSRDDVRLLFDLAFWHAAREEDIRVVYLNGEISAATSFAGLLGNLGATAVIDLAGVTCVTSAGNVIWLDFLEAVPAGLRLRRLPRAVARRLLFPSPRWRRCVVESLLVACECDDCGAGAEVVVEAGTPLVVPTCPVCHRGMVPAEPSGAPDNPGTWPGEGRAAVWAAADPLRWTDS